MPLTIRANTKIHMALAAALILMPTVAAQGFLDQILGPFKGLVVVPQNSCRSLRSGATSAVKSRVVIRSSPALRGQVG